jgi:hypothetical protein
VQRSSRHRCAEPSATGELRHHTLPSQSISHRTDLKSSCRRGHELCALTGPSSSFILAITNWFVCGIEKLKHSMSQTSLCHLRARTLDTGNFISASPSHPFKMHWIAIRRTLIRNRSHLVTTEAVTAVVIWKRQIPVAGIEWRESPSIDE